jgi:hypothetical protein
MKITFGHAHDYEAIAVQHVTAPFSAGGTLILWRCKCSAVYSDRIDGNWTLAQIRGERDLGDAYPAEVSRAS